jgi:hypothetical protein
MKILTWNERHNHQHVDSSPTSTTTTTQKCNCFFQQPYGYDMCTCNDMTIRVLRPHPPLLIQQTGIIIPGNGGVGTLQLWTTRSILSVKMDRENSLTFCSSSGDRTLYLLICSQSLQPIAPQAGAMICTFYSISYQCGIETQCDQ